MRYFPVFMDVQGRRIVVVGGGEEALRKIRLLLKTQAKIEVIAQSLVPELAKLTGVTWLSKSYDAALLAGAALVLSADQGLNDTVSADAQRLGIPVNAVDQADLSTFIVPSIVDRDPVVVAIGTEGTAPVLGQALRARIDALLPQHLGALARKAAGLRGWVAASLAAGKARRAFWHDFFFGPAADAFKDGDAVALELAVGDAAFHAAQAGAGRVSLLADLADVELLTLKAQRRLMEADALFLAPGVSPALAEMARRDALRVAGVEVSSLIEAAASGQNVVAVLSGGAGPHVRALEAAGIAVECLGFATPATNIFAHSKSYSVKATS